MTKWYVDNSRYMLGHSCLFARYIRYHHLGTGYVVADPSPEIKIGHAVHNNVERAYMWLQQGGDLPDKKITDTKFVQDTVPGFTDTVVSLTHAYVRGVLPWVHENYEVVAVEPEMDISISDKILWMSRPDIVVKSRATGKHSIVELKTTRARADKMQRLYKHSLQTLMNTQAVIENYGECESTQLHILQRGSDEYPTPLTHAYYRAGNPPVVSEDWQAKAKRKDGSYTGRLYRKVQVSDWRPLPDWIWEMDISVLADYVPIVKNDFNSMMHTIKIKAAQAAIFGSETSWIRTMEYMSDYEEPLTGVMLAQHIPRSFNCVMYEKDCDYVNVCFNEKGWFGPLPLDGLVRRIPHHAQESIAAKGAKK